MTNKIDFDFMLKVCKPYDTQSFLEGFIQACDQFATWKNGEQRIGACDILLKDIKAQVRDFELTQE